MGKELVIDTDNPREILTLIEACRNMRGTGKVRVTFTALRARRSDRQLRYYWPCFVQPFADWLRGHGNDHFTDEMAHEVLKRMFLERSTVNRKTGTVLTYVASTGDLSTFEFNGYLEQCAAFLAQECDIVVPEPDVWRERDPRPAPTGKADAAA
jgi:hypothetical protein